MGDTERPRYTGFHGLSVRGITALQCKSFPKDNSYHGNDSAIFSFSSPGGSPGRAIVLPPALTLASALALASASALAKY